MTAPIACRCARGRLPLHPTPEERRAVAKWLGRVQAQQARETEDRARAAQHATQILGSCKGPLGPGLSLPRAAVEDWEWPAMSAGAIR